MALTSRFGNDGLSFRPGIDVPQGSEADLAVMHRDKRQASDLTAGRVPHTDPAAAECLDRDRRRECADAAIEEELLALNDRAAAQLVLASIIGLRRFDLERHGVGGTGTEIVVPVITPVAGKLQRLTGQEPRIPADGLSAASRVLR